MKKYSAFIYAFGHFLVDFFCAYLLISQQPEPILFVLYNFCAFALQMPIGLAADMTGCNRNYSILGTFLVLMGLLPFPMLARILLIGIGNACYHVGGGREALMTEQKMVGLGLFVSPGAIGIYLGSALASVALLGIVGPMFLLALALLIYFFCTNERRILTPSKPHVGNAALMFLVVILRSLVGMCLQTPWKVGIFVACGAIAAATGKFFGGFIADRFGWKRTGAISLIMAAVLFCLPNIAIAGILGCLLFNMTMPITLKKAALATPGSEGFSFGLLTFALFLGYLPTTADFTLSPIFGAALALLSALLLCMAREE